MEGEWDWVCHILPGSTPPIICTHREALWGSWLSLEVPLWVTARQERISEERFSVWHLKAAGWIRRLGTLHACVESRYTKNVSLSACYHQENLPLCLWKVNSSPRAAAVVAQKQLLWVIWWHLVVKWQKQTKTREKHISVIQLAPFRFKNTVHKVYIYLSACDCMSTCCPAPHRSTYCYNESSVASRTKQRLRLSSCLSPLSHLPALNTHPSTCQVDVQITYRGTKIQQYICDHIASKYILKHKKKSWNRPTWQDVCVSD